MINKGVCMIKLKIMNYDASEYKMLEEDLNLLAKKGYTTNSIDYITSFKQTNKKAHYICDIFYSDASTQYSKRQEKEEWISSYIDANYQYIGKIRNIHVFKGPNKNKHVPTTDIELTHRYFKGMRTITKMFFLILSLLLTMILIPNVFSNTAVTEFITNGSIIIHYIPIPICAILLFRAFINYYNNEQIKRKLKNKEEPILTNIKKYRKFRNVYLYTLLVSILILLLGIGLDSLERKKLPVDTNKVLTLDAFGLTSNRKEYPTYTKSHSLMIPSSYSFFEQSGTLDVEKEEYGDLLTVHYYEVKDSNSLHGFVNNIIAYPEANNASKIEELSNDVYLSYSKATKKADTMILVKENTFIIISTSLDLSNPTYQKVITDFYLQ